MVKQARKSIRDLHLRFIHSVRAVLDTGGSSSNSYRAQEGNDELCVGENYHAKTTEACMRAVRVREHDRANATGSSNMRAVSIRNQTRVNSSKRLTGAAIFQTMLEHTGSGTDPWYWMMSICETGLPPHSGFCRGCPSNEIRTSIST